MMRRRHIRRRIAGDDPELTDADIEAIVIAIKKILDKRLKEEQPIEPDDSEEGVIPGIEEDDSEEGVIPGIEEDEEVVGDEEMGSDEGKEASIGDIVGRVVKAVIKDRDLMKDTGGVSKGRLREPSQKPSREDRKDRYRDRRKTKDERDQDTDDDEDITRKSSLRRSIRLRRRP